MTTGLALIVDNHQSSELGTAGAADRTVFADGNGMQKGLALEAAGKWRP